MKKKILGALLAATLIVSQAVSVFAAGSVTTDVKPVSPGIEIKDFDEKVLDSLDKAYDGVGTAIKDANAGKGLDKIIEMSDEVVKKELEGKKLVGGGIFDLRGEGEFEIVNGKYKVTLSLPGAKDMKNLKLLHFSYARGTWEVLDVVVNPNGTVTVYMTDFSPAGFVASFVSDNGTEKPAANGAANGAVKSPQTGDWN